MMPAPQTTTPTGAATPAGVKTKFIYRPNRSTRRTRGKRCLACSGVMGSGGTLAAVFRASAMPAELDGVRVCPACVQRAIACRRFRAQLAALTIRSRIPA